MADSFMGSHRAPLIEQAARHGVVAVYPFRSASAQGGLLSYGPDFADFYLQQALYVDRILRGTKPNELPVQVPTKFELVVNLKTAKTLGLELPATLLGRADEVIEEDGDLRNWRVAPLRCKFRRLSAHNGFWRSIHFKLANTPNGPLRGGSQATRPHAPAFSTIPDGPMNRLG
jgi:hypothetical protein